MKLRSIPFAFFVLAILSFFETVGQSGQDSTMLRKDFDRSLQFLNSFRVDSAKILLTSLAAKLDERNELNTEFGMNVLLRQAEAWENDHDDQKAIRQLLELVRISEEKEYWNIYAEANISLARLYEKLGINI